MKRSTVRAGLAFAALATIVFARASWLRDTRRSINRLISMEAGARPNLYSRDELIGLPEPVARYFDFALVPGQPLARKATIEQRGDFAISPDRWTTFTATEHLSVHPPAFVWDARIRVARLMSVHVRDSYVAGEGGMRGAVAGILPVVRQAGTPEMATASLLRYLAEAAWCPTALLPSAGVRWDPLDDRSARATLTDMGVTVSLDAHFLPTGQLARIFAIRHRDVHGTLVPSPWIGRFTDYQRVEGMMVPTKSEIGWVTGGEWRPYWRGRNLKTRVDLTGLPRTAA